MTPAATLAEQRAQDLIEHYDLDNRDELSPVTGRYLLIERFPTTDVYHGSYHPSLHAGAGQYQEHRHAGWQLQELADLATGNRNDHVVATLRL